MFHLCIFLFEIILATQTWNLYIQQKHPQFLFVFRNLKSGAKEPIFKWSDW